LTNFQQITSWKNRWKGGNTPGVLVNAQGCVSVNARSTPFRDKKENIKYKLVTPIIFKNKRNI